MKTKYQGDTPGLKAKRILGIVSDMKAATRAYFDGPDTLAAYRAFNEKMTALWDAADSARVTRDILAIWRAGGLHVPGGHK